MVISNMRRRPDEETMEVIYHDAVKAYPGLSEDMAHHNRLDEGSGGDRSYEFLYNSVSRYIARKRHDRNRSALSKSVLQPTQPALAAEKKQAKKGADKKEQDRKKSAGPRTPSKGPGKGKGKRKGGDRSKSVPRKPICLFYIEGNCTKGEGCPARHISKQDRADMKSKPCNMFTKGACKF